MITNSTPWSARTRRSSSMRSGGTLSARAGARQGRQRPAQRRGLGEPLGGGEIAEVALELIVRPVVPRPLRGSQLEPLAHRGEQALDRLDARGHLSLLDPADVP